MDIETFRHAYNLIYFLDENLKSFGSNSKIQYFIDFAKSKYELDLRYFQVYYLLEQLDPIHKYGYGADMVTFLLDKIILFTMSLTKKVT